MRSTVDINPDLDKQLRTAASESGLTFKEALNRVIAAGLHVLSRPTAKSGRYKVKAKACGLAPGIDQLRYNQLYDLLELEAQAKQMYVPERPAKRRKKC